MLIRCINEPDSLEINKFKLDNPGSSIFLKLGEYYEANLDKYFRSSCYKILLNKDGYELCGYVPTRLYEVITREYFDDTIF